MLLRAICVAQLVTLLVGVVQTPVVALSVNIIKRNAQQHQQQSTESRLGSYLRSRLLANMTQTQPFEAAWHAEYSDKEACDYMCAGPCAAGQDFVTRSGYDNACETCQWNCHSFRSCDDTEACLVKRQTSLYCYKEIPMSQKMPSTEELE